MIGGAKQPVVVGRVVEVEHLDAVDLDATDARTGGFEFSVRWQRRAGLRRGCLVGVLPGELGGSRPRGGTEHNGKQQQPRGRHLVIRTPAATLRQPGEAYLNMPAQTRRRSHNGRPGLHR